MSRQASSRASGPSAIGLTPRCALPPLQALQEQQRLGMNPRPGGLPEWVEMWGVDSFRKTGYVLAGLSAASVPLALGGHIAELLPVLLTGTTAGYWALGLKDIGQKSHTLRRNFPVMIHFRYLLEGIRPEIQQYLIEDEQKMVPYSRAMRNTIYSRAAPRPRASPPRSFPEASREPS